MTPGVITAPYLRNSPLWSLSYEVFFYIIFPFVLRLWMHGAVAEVVGIEGGVVSGMFNLESPDVRASDWRPRHDER